jgi:hypothetical protein
MIHYQNFFDAFVYFFVASVVKSPAHQPEKKGKGNGKRKGGMRFT